MTRCLTRCNHGATGTPGRGLRGKVESLNVSVATAVVLYEILRQRAGTNASTRAAP
jgi:hypothetical protein